MSTAYASKVLNFPLDKFCEICHLEDPEKAKNVLAKLDIETVESKIQFRKKTINSCQQVIEFLIT